MKNSGVGVGIPDWGRVKLIVEDDCKVHIYSGASCIGQGLGTVLMMNVVTEAGVPVEDIVYERSNTWIAPDSGDTSGSRQTTVTGEACLRACRKLKEALKDHELKDLCGQEFYGEYLAKTDPLGANVPNPVSHVAYGYATQMCILDKETGRVKKLVAAHDVGKAINPLSLEGQIEGGVVMSMGYALTERYGLKNCKPTDQYGSLGLFRATETPPEVKAIIVEKPGLKIAGGAIGIGEITSIPTAPAIAEAYYRLTGERERILPLKNTPYARTAPVPVKSESGAKHLTVRNGKECIGCLDCVRACAAAYQQCNDAEKATLRIERTDTGEFLPHLCDQCGKCAEACPEGAITKNPKGVYMINKKKCTGCGKCKNACPKGILPKIEDMDTAAKCIACGLCVKACPRDVLAIAE